MNFLFQRKLWSWEPRRHQIPQSAQSPPAPQNHQEGPQTQGQSLIWLFDLRINRFFIGISNPHDQIVIY